LGAKKKLPKNSATEQDFEFTMKDQISPRLPDGEYQVEFVRHEERTQWKAKKLLLWFKIFLGNKFQGVELFMSCQIPQKKWGSGSKFIRAWAIATGKLPKRFDRVSTNVFRGKIFNVQVRTVTKDSAQKEIPAAAQYSIIDHLISLEQ
jgi:hypothetical protein